MGLVDVLERVLLLAHDDRQRGKPDGAAGELDAHGAQDLAVQAVKATLVHLQQVERATCRLALSTPPMRTSA